MEIRRQDAARIVTRKFRKEWEEGKVRFTADPRTGVIEIEKWEIPGVKKPEKDIDFDKWATDVGAEEAEVEKRENEASIRLKRLLSVDLSKGELKPQDREDAIFLFIANLQKRHSD